jgi:hypothetical protein
MFTRRHTRLAVACATAALALAPPAASARPVLPDPPASPDSTSVEPVPVVRPDGDGLAILLSGAALVVAAAGAGIAGRSQRQVARIAGPHT